MNNKENKNWKSDIKNLIPSDIDFLSLIDRNIMLLIATITFLIVNSLFYSYLYYITRKINYSTFLVINLMSCI